MERFALMTMFLCLLVSSPLRIASQDYTNDDPTVYPAIPSVLDQENLVSTYFERRYLVDPNGFSRALYKNAAGETPPAPFPYYPDNGFYTNQGSSSEIEETMDIYLDTMLLDLTSQSGLLSHFFEGDVSDSLDEDDHIAASINPLTQAELDLLDFSEKFALAEDYLSRAKQALTRRRITRRVVMGDSGHVYDSGSIEAAIDASISEAYAKLQYNIANTSYFYGTGKWYSGQFKAQGYAPYQARAYMTLVCARFDANGEKLGLNGNIGMYAKTRYHQGPGVTPVPDDGNYHNVAGRILETKFTGTQGAAGGEADLMFIVRGFQNSMAPKDTSDFGDSPTPPDPCTNPGAARAELGSAHFNFAMGRSRFGGETGGIKLAFEAPSREWYATRSIAVSGSYGFEEVKKANTGELLQATGPAILVDVNTLSSEAYELHFYHWDGGGIPDSLGRYPVPSGSPHTVFRVENPDQTGVTYHGLKITRIIGTEIDVWTFDYDDLTSLWTLTSDNGNTVETIQYSQTTNPAIRQKEWVKKDSSGTILSHIRTEYEEFAWGEEKIEEVTDPSGAALTEAWDYYDDPVNDGASYGKLKSSTDGYGYWKSFSYDQFGRLRKEKSQFEGNLSSAPESQCRVVEHLYPSSAGGTSGYYTTIERLLGQEIRRSYRKVYIDGYDDIVCVTPGAGVSASDNLVTEVRYHIGNEYTGLMKSVNKPDGTMELYSYTALDAQGNPDIDNGEDLTTVIEKGQPNGAGTAVIDGVRTTTIVDRRGNTLAEIIVDVASGLTLEQRTTTQQDSFGRPLTITLLDGRTETFDYDCCGLNSTTDPLGITTTYDRIAGVSQSETKLGIKTTIRQDGRDTIVERTPAGGGTIELSRKSLDVAGRLMTSETTGNRETTISYSQDVNGNRVVTSTLPNGGTEIETYFPDGTMKSRTGTALFGESKDYGIESGQYFIETTKLDNAGAPTSETYKTFFDLAGRAWKTVRGDGATSFTYFNGLGQEFRKVDPDGVTTLLAYDGRSELNVTAIDLDSDDAISLGGTDLVSRTTTTVLAGPQGFPIVRKTTEVFQADGVATASEIMRLDAEVTGSASWMVTPSGSSQRTLTYGGNGNWTATNQLSDGGTLNETYLSGRLDSSVHSDGQGNVLQSFSYRYDDHGRLETLTDGRNGTTTLTYYDTDEIHTITSPAPGDGRSAQVTTFQYTSIGQEDIVILPDGGQVDSDYYPNGLLKTVSGPRTYSQLYTYTPQGKALTLTTNAGTADAQTTTWGYHPQTGLNTSKLFPGGSNYSVTHTPGGRLETKTNGRGTVTTYGYDVAGRVQSKDYSDATVDLEFSYYRNGDLKTVTQGAAVHTMSYGAPTVLELETVAGGIQDGLVIDPGYDLQNRRTSASFSLGTDTIAQSRDYQPGTSRISYVEEVGHRATYDYHPNSSLLRSTIFTSSGISTLREGRTYNMLSQLTSIASVGSGSTNPILRSFGLTRNTKDQIVETAREDGRSWGFEYDALGHLETAKNTFSNGDLVAGEQFEYQYGLLGSRLSAKFGGDSTGGNLHTIGYTPALGDRSQLATVTTPGAAVATGQANAAASVLVNGSPPDDRQGEYFAHNETVNNSSSAELATFSISATENGVTDAYTAEKLVPIASSTFSYDADGNLSSDGYFDYGWDAENRLTSVETISGAAPSGVAEIRVEYDYDYLSRRIGREAFKKVGGAWVSQETQVFVFDGVNIVGEWNDSAELQRSYLWGVDLSSRISGAGGAGGLVCFTDHTGTTSETHFASHNDGGSVVGLTGATDGETSALYEYDPYGNLLSSTGGTALENPFRFNSQWMDDYTGQLLYLYRAYDPVHGRWLSRDPLGEAGGLNLYAFLANRPIGDADYLGLQSARDSGGGGYTIEEWTRIQKQGLLAGADGLSTGVELLARDIVAVTIETGTFVGNDLALLKHNREEYLNELRLRAEIAQELAVLANQMRVDPCFRQEVIELLGAEIADKLFTVEGLAELTRGLSVTGFYIATGGGGTKLGKSGIKGTTGLLGKLRKFKLNEGNASNAPKRAPDLTTGRGFDAGDTPVRIDGEWSVNDMKQGLLGHPPRGLGSPDIHHGGQMPGGARHEIIPSQHRNNSALHPNRSNQGVTPEMRQSDRQLHWWYRAREQGADQVLPDWIYD